jgi:hypothetical protein
MVQLMINSNLHHDEDLPDNVRGENFLAERICVPATLTTTDPELLNSAPHSNLHMGAVVTHGEIAPSHIPNQRNMNDGERQEDEDERRQRSSGSRTGVNDERQDSDSEVERQDSEDERSSKQVDYVQLFTLGKNVWDWSAGHVQVDEGDYFGIVPDPSNWQSLSGWMHKSNVSPHTYSMESMFYGVGVVYSCRIDFDYGGHESNQYTYYWGVEHYYLQNLRVTTLESNVGHSHSLSVHVTYSNPYNIGDHYDFYTREYSHQPLNPYDSVGVVASTVLTLKVTTESLYDTLIHILMVEVDGMGGVRVLSET